MHKHGIFYRGAVPALVLAALVSIAILMPAGPSRAEAGVKIEWLTWSFFRITTPGGKVILTNPWLKNPDSKTTLADITKADIILVPTGHRDEIGQTVEIARKTGAKVVATHELAYVTFKGKIPLKQTVRVQPGSSITLDMKMWGERFKPDAAMLYAHPHLDPRDIALMARFLSEKNPNLKTVIPHHHRLKPPPGRAPADLGRALASMGLKAKLLDPQPGKVYVLAK